MKSADEIKSFIKMRIKELEKDLKIAKVENYQWEIECYGRIEDHKDILKFINSKKKV